MLQHVDMRNETCIQQSNLNVIMVHFNLTFYYFTTLFYFIYYFTVLLSV